MSAVTETSFFHPKISDFLILNWGRRLMQTEQLIVALMFYYIILYHFL